MDTDYADMQELIRIHANSDGTAPAPRSARERLAQAVELWRKINPSLRALCARTRPATPYGTLNRWLSGEQQPGADRLEQTLDEIRRVTKEEAARLRAVLEGMEP